MSIFDLVISTEIATYWNEMAENRAPFPGEELFPNRKQSGLSLRWIKGKSDIPVVLNPSAFDVHVIPRVREGFQQLRTTMPFFKESYYIDEELRQELLILMSSTQTSLIDTTLSRIFDDVSKLLESAAVSRERMRMALITTGVVAFAANGQAFEYDYGLDPGQLRNATVVWTNSAGADPILDLQLAMDYLDDTVNTTATRAWMNRYTFRLLLASEKVKNEIYVINNFVNSTGVLTDDIVTNYVQQVIGLTITVHNKKFRDEQGTEQKYIPDGVVSILPPGTLGNTWFGTTPEEADLMGVSNSNANVSIVDTGVAITTMVQSDPVNVETKVSQVCLPSFEEADKIVILDVLNAA